MPNRPTMQERAQIYGSAQLLTDILELIRAAYEQTHNENDWLAIRAIEAYQQKVRQNELDYIEEDWLELMKNHDLYPYAVYAYAQDRPDQEAI